MSQVASFPPTGNCCHSLQIQIGNENSDSEWKPSIVMKTNSRHSSVGITFSESTFDDSIDRRKSVVDVLTANTSNDKRKFYRFSISHDKLDRKIVECQLWHAEHVWTRNFLPEKTSRNYDKFFTLSRVNRESFFPALCFPCSWHWKVAPSWWRLHQHTSSSRINFSLIFHFHFHQSYYIFHSEWKLLFSLVGRAKFSAFELRHAAEIWKFSLNTELYRAATTMSRLRASTVMMTLSRAEKLSRESRTSLTSSASHQQHRWSAVRYNVRKMWLDLWEHDLKCPNYPHSPCCFNLRK